jgi:hypothetical protein
MFHTHTAQAVDMQDTLIFGKMTLFTQSIPVDQQFSLCETLFMRVKTGHATLIWRSFFGEDSHKYSHFWHFFQLSLQNLWSSTHENICQSAFAFRGKNWNSKPKSRRVGIDGKKDIDFSAWRGLHLTILMQSSLKFS